MRGIAGRSAAIIVTALALAAGVTQATPRWSEADYLRSLAEPHEVSPAPSPSLLSTPWVPAVDYGQEFIHTADFLRGLQVTNPVDPEFGGEQEGEHLRTIVQSDNTQEVIWVWSHLDDEYGVDSLLYRVGNAWTY